MKFRTDYQPEKSTLGLSPKLPVICVGSCFSDNITNRMRHSLWDAVNPLGTLFNPLSIANAINLMIFDDNWEESFESSVFYDGMKFRSWLFDSKLSSFKKEELLLAFKKTKKLFVETIEKGQSLCVTFGTSYCYYLKESKDFVVANCHKQHPDKFIRKRVSPEEILKVWKPLVNKVKNLYPKLKIVLTVSPVRHLKDGFAGNSISKAGLLLAVNELSTVYDFCEYFPAFEILNDDLRDYRFYASDLIHPSESAIDYIWEIFKQTFLSPEDIKLLETGLEIFKGLSHRPLPDASETVSEQYLRQEEERIARLKTKAEYLLALNPNALKP